VSWKAKIAADSKLSAIVPLLDSTVPETEQRYVDAWIAAIEHQDELLTMALALFKENANPPLAADYSNLAAFQSATNSALLRSYINDAVSMIQYNLSNGAPARVTRGAIGKQTKVDRLFTGATQVPLLKMLLFPNILTNTFIQSLAGILVSLNTLGPKLLLAENGAPLRELLLKQYNDIIKVNATYLTSTEPQDGFFLDQGIAEFNTELGGEQDGFVSRAIDTLISLLPVTDVNELFKTKEMGGSDCPYELTNYEWHELFAHMARYYMLSNASLEGIFKNFTACAGGLTAILDTIPDAAETTAYEGVPLKSILVAIPPVTFQFMVHLRKVVREVKARELAS
jgi:hypothetical protein